jgi:methyl-accepting chemotaxis protein
VQDESTNAVGAIERGTSSVAKGVELSEQAGRSLIEITRVARSNKKLVEGIVQSVREQTKAAQHVVGVIERSRRRRSGSAPPRAISSRATTSCSSRPAR